MAENRSAELIRCPFDEECSQPRGCKQQAVRIVRDNKVILSNDIKAELIELGWGEAAAIKALKFLHHVEKDKEGNLTDVFGCERHVEALRKTEKRRSKNRSNVIYFDRKKMLFFVTPKYPQLMEKVRKLLTEIQQHFLTCLENELFGSYYLSSYEIRKLVPFPADWVRDSLCKLLDLDFLSEVTEDISKIHKRPEKTVGISEIVPTFKQSERVRRKILEELSKPPPGYSLSFFTTPRMEKTLSSSIHSAVLEELFEYEVAKQIHMRIFRKYEKYVHIYGMRTQHQELAKFTKGHSFDSFFKFWDGGKLGVDVFTRLSLSKPIIRAFSGKIETVGCTGQIYVPDRVPSDVAQFCKACGIHLLNIKKATSIKLDEIRKKVEIELIKAHM